MNLKSTLLTLTLGLSTMAVAQQIQTTNRTHSKVTQDQRKFDRQAYKARFQNLNRTTESYWLNYGFTKDFINGGLSETAITLLSTDSLLLGEFGIGNFDHIWLNNVGDVLDVFAQDFNTSDGIAWNSANSYSVDSISVVYGYERNHPNASIVDTLIVQLFTNAVPADMTNSFFADNATSTFLQVNYFTDTLYFKAINYSYTTNSVNATGVTTYKIPLDASDTAITNFRFKFWATNFPVPAGRLVGSSYTFKPGYTYALGDTINKLNAFTMVSLEENGDQSIPSYNYCPNAPVLKCDWNCSYIVDNDIRYNTDQDWNGNFIPAYAFTAPFSFEHHLISYKVTSTNVGISESQLEGATLGQSIPNPTNGLTTIRYTLENAGDVQLDIFDVTGKLVMSFDRGQQNAGNHQVEFDAANLQAGVYFYTLNVNDNKISRRLVVTK
jgi:hypothetical protein